MENYLPWQGQNAFSSKLPLQSLLSAQSSAAILCYFFLESVFEHPQSVLNLYNSECSMTETSKQITKALSVIPPSLSPANKF